MGGRQESRAGQRISEQENYPCSSLRRADSVPHLSSTIELTLLLGLWVSQSQGCEHQETTLPLVCYVVGRGLLSYLLPSPLAAGRRADVDAFMRARERSLPLTCCATQESRALHLTALVVGDTGESALRPQEEERHQAHQLRYISGPDPGL